MGMSAPIANLFGKTPRGPSLLAADQARVTQAQASRPPEAEGKKAEGLRERMDAKLAAQRNALGTTANHRADPE